MAKRKNPEYICTVQYTEDCGQRLTEALVDVYYAMQKGIYHTPDKKEIKNMVKVDPA